METTELGISVERTCLERPVSDRTVGVVLAPSGVGGPSALVTLCVLLTSPGHLLACSMAALFSGSRPRLVGRPLLYSISAFASLGVFLVSFPSFPLSAIY
jgi:hypothetical protein